MFRASKTGLSSLIVFFQSGSSVAVLLCVWCVPCFQRQSFTLAGVVSCGGRKKSSRTSS